MKYKKLPLSFQQQVNLLKNRGLSIPDEPRAIQYLSNISYYRLSAYALPFQCTKDVFNKGTSFDDILNLYLFDRELRLLFFNAIERIEVGLRAQIIYQLAHKYGSHWQDDSNVFCAPYSVLNKPSGQYFTVNYYQELQDTIKKTTRDKYPETFIKHYIDNYTSPDNPPSWMCMEVLTLGQLSKLFKALRDNKDRQNIADYYGLHHRVLQSWLHTLTYVRNICGHHGRLWNREVAIEPLWLKKAKLPWLSNHYQYATNRIFYVMCMIKYLLQTINPSHHLLRHFVDLINKHPNVPIAYMGIPSEGGSSTKLLNWQEENLWH